MINLDKKNIVSKRNDLITQKYDLTLNEQKLILLLASMVQPNDDSFKIYKIDVKEIVDLFNIKDKGFYRKTREIIKNLKNKGFTIEKENGNILDINWLASAEYFVGEGYIEVELSSKLKPYLLNLKTLYTSYKLGNVLSLKSKYSIRIFEIMKSNEFKKEFKITLTELKSILGIKEKSYDIYQNFKNRVLLKAQEEINLNTDINIEFSEIKTGRKVTELKFIIKANNIKNTDINYKKDKQDISGEKEDKENISEDIIILKNLFEDHEIATENLSKILESANGNIEKIKKVYEYSKTQKIDNLVGFMIKMVKGDNFEKPIKQDKNYKKIHNFTEREDYDYQKLESGLLGWDNEDELCENEIENDDFKMNFKADENENNNNIIDEIKGVLEGQLTAIFGELKYKTWIKPSIDNIKIENNNVKFKFSNDFVKNKFENEFENIIKEIIKGIDNNLDVEKIIEK